MRQLGEWIEAGKRWLETGFKAGAIGGAVAILVLALGPAWRVGEGRFESFVKDLELFDFKGPVLLASAIAWLSFIALGLSWKVARNLGLESSRIKAAVEPLTRPVPVEVIVDARIAVRITKPLVVPVEMAASIDVDEEVEIEAELPIRTSIPIDTEVTTTVLRFGSISFPVKAEVPVDMVLPVRGRFRVKAAVPFHLKESATVELPEFEVPVSSKLETKIDLLENLKKLRG